MRLNESNLRISKENTYTSGKKMFQVAFFSINHV